MKGLSRRAAPGARNREYGGRLMTANKILLADGSAATLMRIHAAVKERQYETLTASSGEDAFITAVTERPDLVVIDSAIPGMDALEPCRRLRQNELTRTTPVILASLAGETGFPPGTWISLPTPSASRSTPAISFRSARNTSVTDDA